MPAVSMKALLEAGVHFGHRTRRWNPKMKPYIFTERNGIHIIDLQQTMARVDDAYNTVRDTVAKGGTVLFVGTKKQAQESIQQEAERAGMPYVTQRWLGGTLTNFRTIRQRIEYLQNLEARRDSGELGLLQKKEQQGYLEQIHKLNRRIGGLKLMKRLPDVLFVVDVRREELGVKEANTLHVPVLAMVDTNCDPDPVDVVIPANDDAIRAIKLLAGKMADAAIEGRNIREVHQAEEAEEQGMTEMAEYLGPSTLAKVRSHAYDEAEEVLAFSTDDLDFAPTAEDVEEEPAAA